MAGAMPGAAGMPPMSPQDLAQLSAILQAGGAPPGAAPAPMPFPGGPPPAAGAPPFDPSMVAGAAAPGAMPPGPAPFPGGPQPPGDEPDAAAALAAAAQQVQMDAMQVQQAQAALDAANQQAFATAASLMGGAPMQPMPGSDAGAYGGPGMGSLESESVTPPAADVAMPGPAALMGGY